MRDNEEGARSENIVSGPIVESADRTADLRHQIKSLRKQLAEKVAEYQNVAGKEPRSDTKTVAMVLQLLGRPEGTTKVDLVKETGAKKGYIDALLSRILPSRGYMITSLSVEGTRTKSYRITSEQNSESRTTSLPNSV
jgi:hypothetical protein